MTSVPPAIWKHVIPGTPHLQVYVTTQTPRGQVFVGEIAPCSDCPASNATARLAFTHYNGTQRLHNAVKEE